MMEMKPSSKNYYYAIDLGTTNSVIAYGNITRQNRMRPVVIETDRKTETGVRIRRSLLPSVVFYYRGNDGNMIAEVGDYAKSRYGTKYGHVCKSVKSLMGVSDSVPLVEEIEDKTPSDVSSRILSHLIQGAKTRMFQDNIEDVIITVPASFDSDQCQATLDAAKKAGINVDNEHDILLYEPKAVIYDFLQMQENGEIPSDALDLSTDKNILVYDMGGGTLDVSIHKVGYNQNGVLNIQDIAISRYSQIGGDNFDERIAYAMLKRFSEQNNIIVPIKRREEVMCKLRPIAEQLKMEISNDYEQSQGMGVPLPDSYYREPMSMNLYDSYSYADEITKKEMEEMIAPLLGLEYRMKDYKKIETMTEKDMNNIIYPIFDVLAKAGENCKIDTVILNGGMTKFYPVRERMEAFFGFPPLTTNDPDLAVARGAVYYHYCLHKYNIKKTSWDLNALPKAEKSIFYTGTIMNDAVNIGLKGEYVSRLIEAGTTLPYVSEEIQKYEIGSMTDSLAIEIFLGRGTTKNLPNRRIARRIVRFPKVYPAGTRVSFRIMADQMRMLTMEAWISGKPSEKAVIEIDMNSLRQPFEEKTGSLQTVDKIPLNAKSELNSLKSLYDQRKRAKGKKNVDEWNKKVNECIETIGKASNPRDFFEPIQDMINQCYQYDILLGYLYAASEKLADGWNEAERKKMRKIANRHFGEHASVARQNIYVLRKAQELRAKLDEEKMEDRTGKECEKEHEKEREKECEKECEKEREKQNGE